MIERTIEGVLIEYVAFGDPCHARLVPLIRRYPQFRQELIEFTLEWIRQDCLPPAEDAELDALVSRLCGFVPRSPG